jgi:hypothetical protein
VRILVVVAGTQARALRAEAGKGSVRTAFGHGLVGPKQRDNSVERCTILCKPFFFFFFSFFLSSLAFLRERREREREREREGLSSFLCSRIWRGRAVQRKGSESRFSHQE